jgi:Rrf2 family nitric oxide-sensitive transcriptional repressor
MQLTSFTDYALRVLVYAAVHSDRRCQTADVAGTFGISRHHVVKVVNELAHLGYVDTVRGRDGGFQLARPPAAIRLGEVVRRTEGSIAIVECFDPRTSTCPLMPACGLKDALGEAFGAFLAVLDRHTLADLMAEPRWLARVRGLPRQARRRRQRQTRTPTTAATP